MSFSLPDDPLHVSFTRSPLPCPSPKLIPGFNLDILARQFLWADGLDYRHGTGHGVGHFLNVHEGPQGIGLKPHYHETALQPGHVISNEPGYYADGQFGVRIENVVGVKIAETKSNFGGKGYLEMEHFTMVRGTKRLPTFATTARHLAFR